MAGFLSLSGVDCICISMKSLYVCVYLHRFLGSLNRERLSSLSCKVGRIRAKVFYPAKDGFGGNEAPYLTGGLPTAASYGRLANFPDFMLAHLADAKAGCFFDVPPLDINAESRSLCKTMAGDDNSKLPVLIYSHGYGGNADMATYAMREISSRGVVVFAIEHTDGSAR